MSPAHIDISESRLKLFSKKYDFPIEYFTPKIANLMEQIDEYENEVLHTMGSRMAKFRHDAMDILNAQLSEKNMTLLKDIYQEEIDKGNSPHKSTVLQDAKELFKIHVGSALQETKKDLWHGSALQKLGTTLSFAGRMIEGISIFWDELVKKRPILKPLDVTIIKPIAIGLYTALLPELAIVKACEFVGKSISAVSKTGKWSSIKDVASKMIDSTIEHFGRLAGTNNESSLIEALDTLNNVNSKQKDILKAIVYSKGVMGMVKDVYNNPKTSAAVMAAAMISSKVTGKDLKESIATTYDILSGKNKDASKINIESFCEAMPGAIGSNLRKVYETSTGHLPKSAEDLKDVVSVIQSSDKMDEKIKQELIKNVSAYVVTKSADMAAIKEKNKETFQEAVKESRNNAKASVREK